jgi:hypothetical protein
MAVGAEPDGKRDSMRAYSYWNLLNCKARQAELVNIGAQYTDKHQEDLKQHYLRTHHRPRGK